MTDYIDAIRARLENHEYPGAGDVIEDLLDEIQRRDTAFSDVRVAFVGARFANAVGPVGELEIRRGFSRALDELEEAVDGYNKTQGYGT